MRYRLDSALTRRALVQKGIPAMVALALSASPAASAPAAILLVGASGMIGSRVLAEAVRRGYAVLAAARKPENIAPAPNVEAVALDATDQAAFLALARRADIIILATSPRGGGDPLLEEKAVADAAMTTARKTGKRLIVIGGAGSLNLPDGRPVLAILPPALAHGEALALRNVLDTLKASDIDWTFISPAMNIAPGTRTGVYRTGTDVVLSNAQGVSSISAEDFAVALVDEVEKPAHRRGQMTVAY